MNNEINIAGRPYVFRFRPNNDFTIDEIENNYIFLADKNSLNDPFDSSSELIKLNRSPEEINKLHKYLSGKIDDDITKSFFKNKITTDILPSIIQENIEKFILKFGIACFSMYYMNMPLWANYANNNKGVCFQYNSDLDKDFFKGLKLVNYEEKLIQKDFSPITNELSIIELFYRKEESWSYEKEIRLLKNYKGKLQFNKDSLRNIIIGYNADKVFVNKVFKAIKDNYSDVGVYQMKKPTVMNTISLTEIKYYT